MKTVKMQPTAFYLFKEKANEIRLWFDYKITKGVLSVTADKIVLEKLGY
jgi:hypothetical protein